MDFLKNQIVEKQRQTGKTEKKLEKSDEVKNKYTQKHHLVGGLCPIPLSREPLGALIFRSWTRKHEILKRKDCEIFYDNRWNRQFLALKIKILAGNLWILLKISYFAKYFPLQDLHYPILIPSSPFRATVNTATPWQVLMNGSKPNFETDETFSG